MLSTSFLKTDPENWNMNTDYTVGREVLKHLQVVNDSAERGVALIEEYNQILTKKENQKHSYCRWFKNIAIVSRTSTKGHCPLHGVQTNTAVYSEDWTMLTNETTVLHRCIVYKLMNRYLLFYTHETVYWTFHINFGNFRIFTILLLIELPLNFC